MHGELRRTRRRGGSTRRLAPARSPNARTSGQRRRSRSWRTAGMGCRTCQGDDDYRALPQQGANAGCARHRSSRVSLGDTARTDPRGIDQRCHVTISSWNVYSQDALNDPGWTHLLNRVQDYGGRSFDGQGNRISLASIDGVRQYAEHLVEKVRRDQRG